MKNEYQKELDAIIKRAQKNILLEVENRLQQRWEQIDRILTNGRPIFEHALGERFNRMYYLRSNLITKMLTLSEAQGVIIEAMYKK